MEKKTRKRFYKVGEMVWLKADKVKAKVKELNIPELEAVVTIKTEEGLMEKTVKFMDIDKLRNGKGTRQGRRTRKHQDTVLFAKVRPDAIIPSRASETEAGYDIWANFEQDELRLVKGKANLVPTGFAVSVLPKYYFNLKHERGSTGKYAMSVLSGVCDSSYRGEVFVNICPLDKDVVISKTYDFPVIDGKIKPVELDDVIMYPYSLAICQGTIEYVPNLKTKEISYEELKKIPSTRGDGKLGSSGR